MSDVLDWRRETDRSLPRTIGGMSEFQINQVELIIARGAKITTLPPTIGRFKNLFGLVLENTKITRLPPSFGNLRKLYGLILKNTPITELHESIGRLENLVELNISDTPITTLPSTFGKLKNLKLLRLNDKIVSLPPSFKDLPNDLEIELPGGRFYTKSQYMRIFKILRINNTTEFFNNTISNVNSGNVPRNRWAFININSEFKPNGTLFRVYNKNGLNSFMKNRNVGHLHGGKFTPENIQLVSKTKHIVNKSIYLKKIKNKVNNTPLNKIRDIIESIKSNLPQNVSRNDVNAVTRSMKKSILDRTLNRLRNTPNQNRAKLLNQLKNQGLLNNGDVDELKKMLA